MRPRQRLALALTVAFALFASIACGASSGDSSVLHYAQDPHTINIVAGSEQTAVLDEIVKPWCEAHQLTCNYLPKGKGSVDQARLLSSGNGDYDAYWFASSVFEQVGDPDGSHLQDVKPMFLTPTVFAGPKSVMQELGLVGKPNVTIADILDIVNKSGKKVWMTNPTQSNSGATAYFAALNHFAGVPTGQALTASQLNSPTATSGITQFVRALDQTPPSTRTMMDECAKRPADCNLVFTYEDLVVEHNQHLQPGQEPFYAVYPSDALAISDAPLGFYPHHNEADAGKQQIVHDLQNYVLNDPGAQAKLMQLGRRPVANSFGLTLNGADPKVFNPDWGLRATVVGQEIKFPSAPVIKMALDRYQTAYRRPSRQWFCIDSSSSMDGNGGWAGVKDSAKKLFVPEQAKALFVQANPNDHITVATFNDELAGGPWTADGNNPDQLNNLAAQINDFQPGGGTNMYACLLRAAQDLGDPQYKLDTRKKLVFVMTDGQSSNADEGSTIQALQNAGVEVISIAYGNDANVEQLDAISNATHGTRYQESDVATALREATSHR